MDEIRIDALRTMSRAEVRAALERFSQAYIADWEWWLATPATGRTVVFGQILRRWQATRPYPMRRPRIDNAHEAPFLDDLLARVAGPIVDLQDISIAAIRERTSTQTLAFVNLWLVLAGLTTRASASCVGISKSVLLLTDGRIGPALDSQVRARLAIPKPGTASDWLRTLDAVRDDLIAYEALSGPLREAAPARYAHIHDGRLYDMIFGPGDRSGRQQSGRGRS